MFLALDEAIGHGADLLVYLVQIGATVVVLVALRLSVVLVVLGVGPGRPSLAALSDPSLAALLASLAALLGPCPGALLASLAAFPGPCPGALLDPSLAALLASASATLLGCLCFSSFSSFAEGVVVAGANVFAVVAGLDIFAGILGAGLDARSRGWWGIVVAVVHVADSVGRSAGTISIAGTVSVQGSGEFSDARGS